MKNRAFSIKVEAPKPRHHKVLFDSNSPYRARTIQRTIKDQYQRQPKHRNKENLDD